MSFYSFLLILNTLFAIPVSAGSIGHYQRATPEVKTSRIPSPWSYLGCYTDNIHAPVLNSEVYTDSSMTESKCIKHCAELHYNYAGVELGRECHCANAIQPSSSVAKATDCNMACSGARGELCGGEQRLNIFTNHQPPPTVNGWTVLGCYSDNGRSRDLTGFKSSGKTNTVRNCISTCGKKGFSFAGVESGNECYCGNTINNNQSPILDNLCNTPCTGNSSEMCGGAKTLNLFNRAALAGTSSSTTTTQVPTTLSTTSSTTTTTMSIASAAACPTSLSVNGDFESGFSSWDVSVNGTGKAWSIEPSPDPSHGGSVAQAALHVPEGWESPIFEGSIMQSVTTCRGYSYSMTLDYRCTVIDEDASLQISIPGQNAYGALFHCAELNTWYQAAMRWVSPVDSHSTEVWISAILGSPNPATFQIDNVSITLRSPPTN